MSLTLLGPARGPATARVPVRTSRAAGGRTLLAVLREVVAAGADLDPDLLHSTRPAGRAALTLAAAARAHAAARGVQVGPCLTEGPGILVMRDLVHALGLLESTADPVAVGAEATPELPRQLAEAYQDFVRIIETGT